MRDEMIKKFLPSIDPMLIGLNPDNSKTCTKAMIKPEDYYSDGVLNSTRYAIRLCLIFLTQFGFIL